MHKILGVSRQARLKNVDILNELGLSEILFSLYETEDFWTLDELFA